jgi:hypothetical protein
MANKYYTHFVTAEDRARRSNEWCGVVELKQPIENAQGGARELRNLLASSFEMDSKEIRILHWARLH